MSTLAIVHLTSGVSSRQILTGAAAPAAVTDPRLAVQRARRRLPGGADPAWRAWRDTERMTKQPVPQPLRLAGLCLLVSAMGVQRRCQRFSSLVLAVLGITVVMADLTGCASRRIGGAGGQQASQWALATVLAADQLGARIPPC
jgi:hypothetical protein